MGEIRLLSKSVSDKIAAGEVVERPLSVVKELIENAIDASASAISIRITGGGVQEICVTDNGSGIAVDDVALAFEKHATSKIFSEEDLHHIRTQGFRGEALSSISAVSVAEMKTKQRSEELGMHIRISGGRLDFADPAGLPDGTTVTVSNLFYNVPARRKFLKKKRRKPHTYLIGFAVYPGVSGNFFSLHVAGKNDLPQSRERRFAGCNLLCLRKRYSGQHWFRGA